MGRLWTFKTLTGFDLVVSERIWFAWLNALARVTSCASELPWRYGIAYRLWSVKHWHTPALAQAADAHLFVESLINYRPISNLSIVSKITERAVKIRLLNHISCNSLLNPNKFAYFKHHSTETTLVTIRPSVECYCKQISCLLDLSAAFDTRDHLKWLTRALHLVR